MESKNFFSLGSEKILHHKDRLRNYIEGKMVDPIVVEILPSERCNHTCPQCQAQFNTSSKSEKNHLRKNGVDLDLSLLDSFWKYKPQGVVLSGNTGDPLMHPEIKTLLLRLEDESLPYVLITNGKNLTEEISEIVLRSARGLRISLDAHEPSLYLKTHGASEDDWFELLRKMSQTAKLKQETGSTCDFGVGYLTSAKTKHGMATATKLVRDLGVDYIQFRPFHYNFDSVEFEVEECKKLAGEKFHVFASDQKYSILQNHERTYSKCHGAYFYNVIDSRGNIYMCCHTVLQEKAMIGTLLNNSWQEILESEKRKTVIDSFNVSKCIPLCRLNATNLTIQEVLNSGVMREPQLSDHVLKHVMFL